MLAKMFSRKDSDLIHQDKGLWVQFLDRFRDAKPEVRQECVKFCKYFLVYHPAVSTDVLDKLGSAILDTDDRVRAEAVATVLDASMENLASVPPKLLDSVATRRLDKKPAIRILTVERLARLFHLVARQADEDGEWSESARSRILWIPSVILRSYYVTDLDLRACVERVTAQYLLPAKLTAEHAGERMVAVFSALDDNAQTALARLIARKRTVADSLGAFAEATREGGDGVKLAAAKLLTFVCEKDRLKAKELLMKLAKTASKGTIKALVSCCQPNMEAADVAKARSQLMEAAGGAKGGADCLANLVDLATPLSLTSAKLIEYLPRLKALAEHDEEAACEANTAVLLAFAKHAQPAFADKEVVKLLADNLNTHSAALETGTLKLFPLLNDAITSLAPTVVKTVKKKLSSLAVKGTPTQAKLAVAYLAKLSDAPGEAMVRKVYETLVGSLSLDSPALLTSLKALGYIALHAPVVFAERQNEVISQFIVKALLLAQPTPAEEKAQRAAAAKAAATNEDEWTSSPSDVCLAKVLGIKCIVRRLMGMKDIDVEELKQVAAPSFRLLLSLLDNAGQLKDKVYTPPHDRSRLRLAAACGLLKLASLKPLRACINPPEFLSIAFTIQDSCNVVRTIFARKLNTYLTRFQLPMSYMSMFVLAAIDPVPANSKVAAKYLQDNTLRRRKMTEHTSDMDTKYNLNMLPEYALPHVISLLAHHPDFATDSDTLSEFQQYLQFFFQNIISKDNVNFDFLKGLLEIMKTVLPAHEAENSNPNAMYILCDLALLILLKRSQKTGWKLSSFPGDIVLPQNLFRKPARPLNPKQRYLPVDFQIDGGAGTGGGGSGPSMSPKKQKQQDADTPKKKTPKKERGGSAKKPKKAAKQKAEKVYAEPTRRNAGRAAKTAIMSLAEVENSEGSGEEEEEEEEEEKMLMDQSESKSEENTPASRWQATVHRMGASVLEEADSNRSTDSPPSQSTKPSAAAVNPASSTRGGRTTKKMAVKRKVGHTEQIDSLLRTRPDQNGIA